MRGGLERGACVTEHLAKNYLKWLPKRWPGLRVWSQTSARDFVFSKGGCIIRPTDSFDGL